MNDLIDTGDSPETTVGGQVQTSAQPVAEVQQNPSTGGSYTRIPETGALVKHEPVPEQTEQE
ncbi:hypothetical protein [Massilia aerilata]|uniref:Uncharacterized protein n=1 Tax=Massilia aerilata TaxID=453817 RepID=A0ABW0S3Y2_9BURK